MPHFILHSVLLAGLALLPSLTYAAEEQDERVEFHGPNIHPGYPDAFHVGYLLKKSNVSPNGKYGVIFPANADTAGIEDLIVGLQPSRILCGLATKSPHFQGKNHGGLLTHWAPDSSAVVVINKAKWEPYDITVIEFKDGHVSRQTDILPALQQTFGSAITKAEHASHKKTGAVALYVGKVEWILQPRLQVRIRCEGETNPKGIPGQSKWTGTLEAVWDVEQSRHVSQKIIHQSFVLKVEETE